MNKQYKTKLNKNKKDSLVAIVGPTAAGKTSISLKIAKKIKGEIISADSMQIYKDMDIGTDKVNQNIREKIPHHMLDIISPDQNFSVAKYQQMVDNLITDIHQRDHIPVLVGGTGLYVKAVIQGFLLPKMEKNHELRNNLRKKAKKYGNQYIHNILAEIDGYLAQKLHPNDIRRVIRGIEIYFQTGRTKTYFKKLQKQKPPRYRALKIGVTRNREQLYQKINQRVEEMIENGLIKEVQTLQKKYNLSKTALQALGYKEILGYLEQNYSLKEATRLIKKNTRNFAKRQLTWFRRDNDIHWFNLSEKNIETISKKIIKLIMNFI
ncbi:MAG: tRNA (adenosine(37)-N6)-dimethylallyltransferase MiaA [Halanaerobiaceae bacterium]